MTDEGQLLSKLLGEGVPGQSADINVYVVSGCTRAGCSCAGRTSVRLVIGMTSVECYDPESIDSLMIGLEQARAQAWGDPGK